MNIDTKVWNLAEEFVADCDNVDLRGNPRDAVTQGLAEVIQRTIELYLETLSEPTQ